MKDMNDLYYSEVYALRLKVEKLEARLRNLQESYDNLRKRKEVVSHPAHPEHKETDWTDRFYSDWSAIKP